MTRIVNIQNVGIQTFNIDPTTGETVDLQYDMLDPTGEVILTDSEGQPQLNINTISLESTQAQVDYGQMIKSIDVTIGELTGGARSFVLSDDVFGTLCSVELESKDALSILVEKLKAEIERLTLQLTDQSELNRTIFELRSELESLTNDFEELVTAIEVLRECNSSLERAATTRDDAVQQLSIENKKLSFENAALRSEVIRLGGSLNSDDDGNRGGRDGGVELDGDGNVVVVRPIDEIRRIARTVISDMSTSNTRQLVSEIAIIRSSTVMSDIHDAFDTIFAEMNRRQLEKLRIDIDRLEQLLDDVFYSTRQDDFR